MLDPSTDQQPSKATRDIRSRRFPVRRMVPNMVTLLALCLGLTALRQGLAGHFETAMICIIIAAFLLAAGMDVSGGLDKLLQTMIERARSVFGLVAATLASGATMIALTSHGGVTALIVGGLFQDGYRERGLAPENLSRSLEDSVTILEPMLPWTVSAIFMATTLGVPTLEYMPWAVFCMTGWMFSLLMASIYERPGFGLKALQAE